MSLTKHHESAELLQNKILGSKLLLEEIFAILSEDSVEGNKLVSIAMRDMLEGYRLVEPMPLNIAKKLHSISDTKDLQKVCKILSDEIVCDISGYKSTVGYGILMNGLEKHL